MKTSRQDGAINSDMKALPQDQDPYPLPPPGGKSALAPFDEAQYETHKVEVAVIMGQFFIRYLNLLYREFEGDLVLPIVLGEIAHHNIHHFYSKLGCGMKSHKPKTSSEKIFRNLEPTNAFSISEATGIPRETVRRKIDKLQKKGWITRNERGEVFLSTTVSDDFTKGVNRHILSELLETSRCLHNLMDSGTGIP